MFKIRLIQESDNPGVRALIHTVMPEFGCNGPGFALTDPEVDHMFESYTPEDSVYFVLDANGKLVGGAGIAPLDGDTSGKICELRKMYFLPEARGKGFGSKLLNQCTEEARLRGYKKCYLETVEHMTQARLLYERSGFVQINAPMGKTGHHGCDCWYLKTL